MQEERFRAVASVEINTVCVMRRLCPKCGEQLQLRNGYLGAYWGCPKFDGTLSAKGTYMRAAQMAEEEFDGRPLVPVIRLRAGEYKSRDGLILFRLVKFKKISSNYWEAVDTQTGADRKKSSETPLQFSRTSS